MNRILTRTAPAAQLREALRSDLDTLPDAELLDRFARYADHPAFESLLRRHGPMVHGVCRRMLSDADADDAFQATFLVFIRKGRSLRRGDRLGPWLYGVARRVATRARSRAARLAVCRAEANDMIPDPTEPAEVPDWLPILDAELAALPAKYRDALVLCELQGASRADAAKALGLREGTLSSRLARGRDLLRKRLLKHGTLLPAGGLAALFSASGLGRAAVPVSLLTRTSELAKVATGASAGAVPVSAARLTDEVLKGMMLTKLRACGAALALLVAFGVAAAALPGGPANQPEKPKTSPKAAGTNAQPAKPAPGKALPDRDALQGLWLVEKFDVAGKGVTESERKQAKEAVGKMQFLVAGDVWWGMEYNRDGGVWSWTAVLDPTKNPKWLDLHDRAKGVLPGLSRCIYELDGDVLRICTATGFGPRPAEFATDPDASLTVISLRRGKMPPPAGEKALVGRWVGEPVVIKGGPEERERTFTPQAEILDSYLFLMHGADEWIGGKYTVDTTKNPKWIDVELVKPLPGDEKVTKLYGCYEVADGRLKITLGARRATRPLEFKEGDMIYFDLKATKEALHPPPVASKELVPAPVPPSNPPVTTTPPSKR